MRTIYLKTVTVTVVALLLLVLVGCRVYSTRHPANSSKRVACAQALKYGWCGDAYRSCRRKPPGCKRELGVQR